MNDEIMDKLKELEACNACDNEYVDLINQFPQHRHTRFDNVGDEGKQYELFLEWIENEPDNLWGPWLGKPGYGCYSHIGDMPKETVDTCDTKINADTMDEFISWNAVSTELGEIASKSSVSYDELNKSWINVINAFNTSEIYKPLRDKYDDSSFTWIDKIKGKAYYDFRL